MKKFLCIIIALMLAFLVVGCNNPSDISTVQSSSKSTQRSSKSTSSKNVGVDVNNSSTSSSNQTSSSSQTNSETQNEYPYTTENGVSFKASGFASDIEGFTFTDKLTLTFSGDDFIDFNRLSLSYSSSSNLSCKVYYQTGEGVTTDEFYLEEGEKSFNGLIGGYLDRKTGENLKTIEIKSLEGGSSSFSLKTLSSEKIEVYSDEVYYIENARFKLGIKLIWGGGICYIADKNCKVSGLTNLVNQADTGRLIQQSYYGTDGSNSDYVSSKYNQNDWPYNPVQGGDVAQNHSKLIDISVTSNSVYIKSQPMDWAKDGFLTPSYMENTYTLSSDNIRVDNRFIDFSSWTHRVASQELPAFYTVSYLDEFTWYNGSKPWTDASLSTEKNLPFWGDNQHDCTFYQKYSNTETWCAWTNASANYGIGLFVPNTDVLLAGRHAYNGSKDSLNNACNYVAPVNNIELKSFQPIEYSYLIACGSLSEIRGVFKQNKDFASNESLRVNCVSRRVADGEITDIIDCTVNGSEKTFANLNSATSEFDSTLGAVKLTSTGVDSYACINYSLAETALYADNYDKLVIEYMIPTSNSQSSYNCDIFLCAGATLNPDGNMRVRETLTKSGAFQKIEIDLSNLSYFSGKLNLIRFDFFDACQAGDAIYVKSFALK